MYQILKVGRSAYYYLINKKPSDRLIRRLELGVAIKKVFDWSKSRYGSPRIARELQIQGIWLSRPLVSRIMKKKNLKSVVVRKFKQTSNSEHKYALVENRLNQDFTTTSYNQVWVSDITLYKNWSRMELSDYHY